MIGPLPRRLFVIGLSSICISHVARADLATDAAAPIARLNAALETRSANFSQRVAMLEPVLEQSFDLPTVLRASVGLGWATLSAADQQNLLQVFRRYIAANYAANFTGGQQIRIMPEQRSLPGGGEVVQTQVVDSNGEAHRIDYVMRRTAAGWRAEDVLADGTISRVAVQRSDFASILARSGAAGLATRMAEVAASLGSVA